ncbi:MAG: ABC transporter ATP-binding protein/permease [Lachnospiraceae bacterium]|nr:ABC transporter ATP-binding protein/permease [Lachnospiraceae bacterium]
MKRFFKYVKPYLPFFILGPIMMVCEVAGDVWMPRLMANIINIGAANGDTGYILMTGFEMIGVACFMALTGILGAYFGTKGSVYFARDLRKDVFGKIQQFSFSNIDRFSTGSLVTRLTNDITQVQNLVNMMLRMMFRAPFMLIGALVMAISMNAQLAMILVIVIPILIVVIGIVIYIGFPRFEKMQKKIDALNSNIREALTNVRVIKSFVREDYEEKKFAASNRDLKEAGLNAFRLVIFTMPIMALAINITTLAVVWFGGRQILVGTMQVGELTAFTTYIIQVLISLMMLAMILLQSSRAIASGKRILEVLDEKLDLNDEEAKSKDHVVGSGSIRFEHVSFRYYKESEEKVLNDINVEIPSGTTVGIIGSTGCGKTTLVQMIPRLYDVDEGAVYVDGVNVKDYSLYNLREGVGMVLQKNVLFSGTIEENLLWGNPDASEEEIQSAAMAAQAHDFITATKDGYETDLGQGGVNVSGGQKQRLCIARAMLKKPKILILDDSTSAVDTATEARIREAFADSLKDTTKLIIAQRISSVKDADLILVMDEGQIVGQGTHGELMNTCETYQEIYSSQMDREVSAS